MLLYFVPSFQYYLCSTLMALLAVSVFLRVDFLLKLLVMVGTAGMHMFLISFVSKNYFLTYYDGHNDGWVVVASSPLAS